MKVLFCASEALPFAATGGLADVAGSLPQALRTRLIGCRVVMPLYESVPQELREKMKFLTSISVPVAWRRQYCGIFEAKVGNVIYYLIDNQYYFKRQGLYGHFDDAERFAFFSRAVLEMLPYIEFKPDIIHANDWQTALVPIYYRLFYANNDWYSGIKTLFTIHNIQYQGQYGFEILEDVFRHPEERGQPARIQQVRQPDEGCDRKRQLGLHRQPDVCQGDPRPVVRATSWTRSSASVPGSFPASSTASIRSATTRRRIRTSTSITRRRTWRARPSTRRSCRSACIWRRIPTRR